MKGIILKYWIYSVFHSSEPAWPNEYLQFFLFLFGVIILVVLSIEICLPSATCSIFTFYIVSIGHHQNKFIARCLHFFLFA